MLTQVATLAYMWLCRCCILIYALYTNGVKSAKVEERVKSRHFPYNVKWGSKIYRSCYAMDFVKCLAKNAEQQRHHVAGHDFTGALHCLCVARMPAETVEQSFRQQFNGQVWFW